MKMIAVWFSCGAASAVAAYKTIEKYKDTHTIRIINNPVIEEDSDNIRFLKDVEKWLGVKVETARNPKFPDNSAVSVWDKRKFMSGVAGAPCTTELKKNARYLWEKENKPDYHVLGFTFDEVKRHERFIISERDNVIPVLIDHRITKSDCYQILQEQGIQLPRVYTQGYPNANCIGCVKATSPTYWNHVREKHESVFNERAKQSRKLGAKLVRHKGERIFLDELPTDAKGRPMKNMDFECGIFCEERK
mgnify:FL=1|tara:strand:+ start:219 stop:962 length:744 start_codon:yes stop_codon:yes gene_type:complete